MEKTIHQVVEKEREDGTQKLGFLLLLFVIIISAIINNQMDETDTKHAHIENLFNDWSSNDFGGL